MLAGFSQNTLGLRLPRCQTPRSDSFSDGHINEPVSGGVDRGLTEPFGTSLGSAAGTPGRKGTAVLAYR